MENSKDFKIKNGVITKYIGSCEDVVIPDGVESIGNSAFEGQTGIKSVTIPESVTFIDSGAFYNCSNLESIQIANKLTKIGTGAFSHCEKLADENGLVIVNDILFGYYGEDYYVEVPESIKRVDVNTFCKSQATYIVFKGMATMIDKETFRYYSPEEHLTINAKHGSYAERYAEKNNIIFEAQSISLW